MTATLPVEATAVTTEVQLACQDASYSVAVNRPEVQSSGPASQIFPGTSGRSEAQPPGPTGHPATTLKNRSMSLTSTAGPSDEPFSDEERFSHHAPPSHMDEEGEILELESTGRDHEELIDVNQELSAEQTCRETICGEMTQTQR